MSRTPARSRAARLDEIRRREVDAYAAPIVAALPGVTPSEYGRPALEVRYATVDLREACFPERGYLPGDALPGRRARCVADPADYTDALRARLAPMGLVATGFRAERDPRGLQHAYFVRLANPFRGARAPYADGTFWDAYEAARAADLARLLGLVHAGRAAGQPFEAATSAAFCQNLVRAMEELGPEDAYKIERRDDGYLATIRPSKA